jgi:two-component system capsular synthesis sensor histidine kinase RcsC
MGMQGVLVKPITLEALQRLLIRITQGDAAVSAPPQSPVSTDTRDDDPPLQVPANAALFVQTMQADLDSLRQSIATADPARVVQVLHRIRGALVIVGAPALVDSGLQIEQGLAGGDDLATQEARLPASSDASNSCCIRCSARHLLPHLTTRTLP